jgi:Putative Flp pilus-assembly TadE/G-like
MSPIFVLSMVCCVLFCGLTVDVGRMELLKIQMQSASDAAAVGAELASEEVPPGASGSYVWQSQGKSDASANGFTDGTNGVTVTIHQNPTSGNYQGRYDAIQVTVTQSFQAMFLGFLHSGVYTLQTQSVALVPPCSYFLGGSSVTADTVWMASAWLVSDCPIYVNYSELVDGFARGWGFGFDVSGPAAASASTSGWTTQAMEEGYGGVPPQQAPTFGTPVLTDPLVSITQPSFPGGCPGGGTTITSGTHTLSNAAYTSLSVSNATVTLDPGTYCGTASTVGWTFTGSTVTLNPGLYVITGGALMNGTTFTGTGVTLFFTKGNGAQYGQFKSGTTSGQPCTMHITAPTTTSSGGIPGILWFADRNWVSTSTMDFQFDTNDSFAGDGIWYFPNTGVYIWQNSLTAPNYSSFVTRNLYSYNTALYQNQNYSWLSGGSPFRTQSVLVQ